MHRGGSLLEEVDAGAGVVQALLVVGQVALICVMLTPAQTAASECEDMRLCRRYPWQSWFCKDAQ